MKTTYDNNKLPELSVFFPCYNEEGNLPVLLEHALKVIPTVASKYEIIIVNDGSTDNTVRIANIYAEKYPFIRVINQENQGYGGALNTGLHATKYKWVFFTDADLQFNISEIKTFIENSNDFDLIIGYRKERVEGFRRYIQALGMKTWNWMLLGFPLFIKDIDCAFKLIKKEVIDDVGPLMSKGNLVTSEFLLKAYKKNYAISQIGVTHYDRISGVSKCGGFNSIIKVIKESYMLLLTIETGNIKKYAYDTKLIHSN